MSCTLYMVNCNSTIHVTFLLTLRMYKYSKLQGHLQNTFFSHSDLVKKNFQSSCGPCSPMCAHVWPMSTHV